MSITKENNSQKMEFGRYIDCPTNEQLTNYFHLDDKDRTIIETMKKDSTKLGFAVQLGTVRFLGIFPTNFENIPFEVIHYLANQLGVLPQELQNYTRKPTLSQHAKLIREAYHYRSFNQDSSSYPLGAKKFSSFGIVN